MSFESRTSYIDQNAEKNDRQMAKRLPEKPSSPLMFDDDLISVCSQLNRSYAYNRVISNQNSPSERMHSSKIPSNECSAFTMPRSHGTESVFLSASQIERVNACLLCIDDPCLNESADYHNRTITEAQNSDDDSSIDSVIGSLPKRARLDETVSDVLLNFDLNLDETSDISADLFEQTKAIDDQISSLHEDW